LRSRLVHGTSISLTELSFGGASLGNLYSVTSEDDSRASIGAAWECGIRYFDTAPHYGLGLSERRLGAALAEYPRSEWVVSTKVGRLIVANENPTRFDSDFVVPGDLRREWDFSRDGILRSIDDSLARLGTDYLDIVYLHDPDQCEDPRAAMTGAEALVELREQGMVRAIGIGSNSVPAVAALFLQADIDLAMLAGRYTLLEQDGAAAVFEAAGDRSIVAVGVFNSGLLSTPRPLPDSMYDYQPVPGDLYQRAHGLADIAEAHAVTLPQAAIAFPLRNPQVVSAAIGMRNAAQVRANVALYEAGVASSVWDAMQREGFLDPV